MSKPLRFNNYEKYDKWVNGRVNPHGVDWLKEYAQKDFSRPVRQSLIKKLINKLRRR